MMLTSVLHHCLLIACSLRPPWLGSNQPSLRTIARSPTSSIRLKMPTSGQQSCGASCSRRNLSVMLRNALRMTCWQMRPGHRRRQRQRRSCRASVSFFPARLYPPSRQRPLGCPTWRRRAGGKPSVLCASWWTTWRGSWPMHERPRCITFPGSRPAGSSRLEAAPMERRSTSGSRYH